MVEICTTVADAFVAGAVPAVHGFLVGVERIAGAGGVDVWALVVGSEDKVAVGKTVAPNGWTFGTGADGVSPTAEYVNGKGDTVVAPLAWNDVAGEYRRVVVATGETDEDRELLEGVRDDLLAFYGPAEGVDGSFGARLGRFTQAPESDQVIPFVMAIFGAMPLNRNGWYVGSFEGAKSRREGKTTKKAVKQTSKVAAEVAAMGGESATALQALLELAKRDPTALLRALGQTAA